MRLRLRSTGGRGASSRKQLDVRDLVVCRVVVLRVLDEVEAVTRTRLGESTDREGAADGDVENERLWLEECIQIAGRSGVVRSR